jgi:hypothetical protein
LKELDGNLFARAKMGLSKDYGLGNGNLGGN